ncbi:MAG: hypothetical protein WA981_12920 [Glaciecola sp.]
MKNTTFNENHTWANEFIILYEAKNELILLERNVILNTEHVIMTTSLRCDNETVEKKHWCSMVDYHYLLPHIKKIKRFQRELDNYKLFKLFFNLSVDEFFEQIQIPCQTT